MLTQPAFAPLQHYLTDDGDKRKIHQLAGRVADLFDQYLVYRPQWLESWQRGERIDGLAEAQQWQAPLWARLVEYTQELGQPEWHRANLYSRFIHALEQAKTCPPGLPPRVFICGISALPPVYLEALQALGRHIDIHLMFTNPCRYYWGDIQDYAFSLACRAASAVTTTVLVSRGCSASRMTRRACLTPKASSSSVTRCWPPGKLGRDHLYLLSQMEGAQEVDAFVDIPADTMLHAVQRDMLELEDHAVIGITAETLESSFSKRPLDENDRSLSLHACHSPQREVEVLHDQLLSMLAQDPSLTPRDIIVMVADIDSYTPYIQAVFGNAPAERYLPFAISDRKARRTSGAAGVHFTARSAAKSLYLGTGTGAAGGAGPCRPFRHWRRGLRLLRHWVGESGVRWGPDDDNVRELDLPATGQHTGASALRVCCSATRWTAMPAIGRAFYLTTNRADWSPSWRGSWRNCWRSSATGGKS